MGKHFSRCDQKAERKIVFRIECKTIKQVGVGGEIKQQKGKVPILLFCKVIKCLLRPISFLVYHLQ